MRVLAALLLLSFAALPCASASAVAADNVPKWVVDRKKSTIEFKGFKDGKPFTSVFQSWSADIAFDPENLTGSSAAVTIDTRSATTGDKTFTEYLVAPGWYDPEQAPYAMFQIQSLTRQRDTLYNANGTLYLYNKTKSVMIPVPGVSLPVFATVKGNTAEFRSTFTFAIPDFKAALQKKNAFRKITFNMLLKTHKAGTEAPAPTPPKKAVPKKTIPLKAQSGK